MKNDLFEDTDWLKRYGELSEEKDNLKCCGNCKKHEFFCFLIEPDYCKDWISDNKTRKEREI